MTNQESESIRLPWASDFVIRISSFVIRIFLAMSPDAVNQKLVDQYTEIARLAGGLAHEIKNPLSTIRLNMELLAEDFRASEAPRDRRAMRKIDLVAARVPAAAGPAGRLPGFRQGAAAETRTERPERAGRAGLGLLPPQGPGRADRGRRLSLQRSGHRALGPREFSRGPVEPRAQCPAGHARGRAVGRSHLQHGPGRGAWT